MAWLQRLNDPLRQPLSGTLGEAYAAQLERLGAVAPFELAVLGGRAMATPGLAFLIGYQAALRVLWPSAPASLGALCATERRSVRPADMHTRLVGLPQWRQGFRHRRPGCRVAAGGRTQRSAG